MRIVSLLPSSTEIVAALGMAEYLVARSHECDFPPEVKRLPSITAPKFNPDGRSYEINQRVKAILQEAVAVYTVDADRLKALQPDIIVTQSQCDVCAVSFEEVKRITCEWLDTNAQLVALEPNSLDDVFTDIQRVADALNVPERGQKLVDEMQARMASIEQKTRKLSRPTVASIEWIDPLMAAGNWMPTLIEMAGGINIFGVAGQHSPWIDFDALRAANPDVIIVIPCGYDIATSLRELPALTTRPDWQDLKAVQQNQVYVADGNQFFNRPGPRLVESLEILAEILHPNDFDFGHKNRNWQPLTAALR
ncbi:MAG: cobalamin-binding protein [Phototrophicales bacterium]|nr:MAG: cobalamin-binding protein [Phototrophicales bacterium]